MNNQIVTYDTYNITIQNVGVLTAEGQLIVDTIKDNSIIAIQNISDDNNKIIVNEIKDDYNNVYGNSMSIYYKKAIETTDYTSYSISAADNFNLLLMENLCIINVVCDEKYISDDLFNQIKVIKGVSGSTNLSPSEIDILGSKIVILGIIKNRDPNSTIEIKNIFGTGISRLFHKLIINGDDCVYVFNKKAEEKNRVTIGTNTAYIIEYDMNFIYGFDFDGVIHSNIVADINKLVNIPDPDLNLLNGYDKINVIDNLIKSLDEYYIISERPEKDKTMIENAIMKITKKKPKDIILTNGKEKWKEINKLQINYYYEDSYDYLKEIVSQMRQNKMINFLTLFYVVDDTIDKIYDNLSLISAKNNQELAQNKMKENEKNKSPVVEILNESKIKSQNNPFIKINQNEMENKILESINAQYNKAIEPIEAVIAESPYKLDIQEMVSNTSPTEIKDIINDMGADAFVMQIIQSTEEFQNIFENNQILVKLEKIFQNEILTNDELEFIERLQQNGLSQETSILSLFYSKLINEYNKIKYNFLF